MDFSRVDDETLQKFEDALRANDLSSLSDDELNQLETALTSYPRPEVGFWEDMGSRLGIGWNRLQDAAAILADEVGLIDEDTAANFIVNNYQDIVDYADRTNQDINDAVQKISEAKSFGDVWQQIKENPVDFARSAVAVSAESLPISIPMIAAGVGGALLGGPVGGAAAAGSASGAIEYALSLTESMQRAGLSPNKKSDIKKFFSDEAMVSDARERAALRGLGIGVFDALSFGVAGKLFGPAKGLVTGAGTAKSKALQHAAKTALLPAEAARVGAKAAAEKAAQAGLFRSGLGSLVGGTAEMIPQMAFGGAGEAAGQALTGEWMPGEITYEAAAELFPGAVESTFGGLANVAYAGRNMPTPREVSRLDSMVRSEQAIQQNLAEASRRQQGIVSTEGIVESLPFEEQGIAGLLPDRRGPGYLEYAAGREAQAVPPVPRTPPTITPAQAGTETIARAARETATPYAPVPLNMLGSEEQGAVRMARYRAGVPDMEAPVSMEEVRNVLPQETIDRIIGEQKPLTLGTGAMEAPTIQPVEPTIDPYEYDVAVQAVRKSGKVALGEVQRAIGSVRGGNIATPREAKSILAAMVARGVLKDKSGKVQKAIDAGTDPAKAITKPSGLTLSETVGEEVKPVELPEGTNREFAIKPVVTEQRKGKQWTYSIDGEPSNQMFDNQSAARQAAEETAQRRTTPEGETPPVRLFRGRQDYALVERARNQDGELVGERPVEAYTPPNEQAASDLNNQRSEVYPDAESARRAVDRIMPVAGREQQRSQAIQQDILDQYQERMAGPLAALNRLLEGMNLKDVGLKIQNALFDEAGASVEGVSERGPAGNLITVISDIYDPNLSVEELTDKLSGVMNHEIIHSLLDLGVITPPEWKVLSRFVGKQKYKKYGVTYQQWADRVYADLSGAARTEEAVAEAFRSFSERKSSVTGAPAAIFRRIVQFVRRLGNWLRGQGYQTAEDIFGRIQEGEVGGRERGRFPRGQIGPPKYSRNASMHLMPRYRDDMGFYSKLEVTIRSMDPDQKMTGEQAKKRLLKLGIKPEELTWTGLDEYFKTGRGEEGKFTPSNILDYVKNNQVNVVERIAGAGESYEREIDEDDYFYLSDESHQIYANMGEAENASGEGVIYGEGLSAFNGHEQSMFGEVVVNWDYTDQNVRGEVATILQQYFIDNVLPEGEHIEFIIDDNEFTNRLDEIYKELESEFVKNRPDVLFKNLPVTEQERVDLLVQAEIALRDKLNKQNLLRPEIKAIDDFESAKFNESEERVSGISLATVANEIGMDSHDIMELFDEYEIASYSVFVDGEPWAAEDNLSDALDQLRWGMQAEVESINNRMAEGGVQVDTEYDTWTLPGGENYREIALAFPKQYGFSGAHFGGDDVYAHLRTKDRTAADGKPVYFVEEFQSDWAANGRKFGFQMPKLTLADLDIERISINQVEDESVLRHAMDYRNKNNIPVGEPVITYKLSDKAMNDYKKYNPAGEEFLNRLNYSFIPQTDQELFESITSSEPVYDDRWTTIGARRLAERSGVPDAPYVKSVGAWLQNVIKYAIADAINQNHTRMGWTTGDQQVARYPGISKENQEGMRNFYDEMVPRNVLKVARIFDKNAKVISLEMNKPEVAEGSQYNFNPTTFNIIPTRVRAGTTVSVTDRTTGEQAHFDHDGSFYGQSEAFGKAEKWAEARQKGTYKIHAIEFSEDLVKGVRDKGFPRFSRRGPVNRNSRLESGELNSRFIVKNSKTKNGKFGTITVDGDKYDVFIERGVHITNTQSKVTTGFGLKHLQDPARAKAIMDATGLNNYGDVFSDFFNDKKVINEYQSVNSPNSIRVTRKINGWKKPLFTVLEKFDDGDGVIIPEEYYTIVTAFPSPGFDFKAERPRRTGRYSRRDTPYSRRAMAIPEQDRSFIEKVIASHEKPTWVRKLADKITGRLPEDGPGFNGHMTSMLRNSINSFARAFDIDRILNDGRVPVDHTSVGRAMEGAMQMSGRMEILVEMGPLIFDPVTQEIRINPNIPGLVDIFERIGQRDKEYYAAFAIALRERDLRASDRQGFFSLTDDEIDGIISRAPAYFHEVSAAFQEFNDAMIDFAVASGILSPEKAENFREVQYVPYYRIMAEDEAAEPGDIIGPKMGAVLNNPRSALDLRLEGGEAPIGDFYDNIIRNYQSILSASLKNVALDTAAKSIDKLNELGMENIGHRIGENRKTRPPGVKDVMTFRRNGEPVFYKIDDAPFWIAIASMHPQQRSSLVTAASRFAGLLRAGVTLVPGFMLANLWRGKITAYVTTDTPLEPGIATFRGFVDTLKGGVSTQAIKAQTGIGGYTYGMSERDFAKEFARRQRRQEKGGYGFMQDWKDRFVSAIRYLEHVGEATELAERVALYDSLRRSGVDQKDAAYEAMNMINFGRRGAGRGIMGNVLVSLIPMVPFLNARLQGLYRVFEDQKGQRRIGHRRYGIPLQTFTHGLMVTLASTMIYSLFSDDDRWDDEPLDRKVNYDIMYIGDKTFYLPRAFEVGSLFATFPVLFYDLVRNQRGRDFARGVQSVFLNTLAFNPIPQAALPLIESVFNYNSFTMTPIESLAQRRLLPEYRFDERTTGPAKILGELTGRYLGVSPLILDHVVTGYTGSMGASLLALTDSILGGFGVIPNKPAGLFGDPHSVSGLAEELFNVKRFVREDVDRPSRFIREFYRLKSVADEAFATMNEAVLRGDLDRARQVAKKNKLPIRLQKTVDRIGRQISDVNRRIRAIRFNPKMDPAEKRRRLEPLMRMKRRLASRMVKLGERHGF